MKHPIIRDAGVRALESLVHPVTSPVAQHYHDGVVAFLEHERRQGAGEV
jgi:hypothetical protein